MDCIIFFTKVPRLGYCKTRLGDFLSDEQILTLTKNLINQNYEIMLSYAHKEPVQMIVYYSGAKGYFRNNAKEQRGYTLGEKMLDAIKIELKHFDKVVLIGSDIANLKEDIIKKSFDMLEKSDIVIAPCDDGGYGLIGMKDTHDIFSGITYSTNSVFKQTIEKVKSLNLRYEILDKLYDIDTKDDLVRLELGGKKAEMIGHGEYNINYRYDDKVYRINRGSQLHLGNRQIEYEYNALKYLEKTGVTPKVYEYNLQGKYIPYGNLVMDYLEGRTLDYHTDLEIAAKLLSSVHNLELSQSHHFIIAYKPFETMYEEFETMYSVYKKWDKKQEYVTKYINKFLQIAKSTGLNKEIENPCIINTELNNQNFIIGEKSYIIDWEKPIIGECEQDIAHFLVPTTTNWKTDVILSSYEREKFITCYEKYRKIDRAKLDKYMMFNTLRGVTWCSMAKVEYSSNRALKNNETLKKINKFLSVEFLEYIYKNFYEGKINAKK